MVPESSTVERVGLPVLGKPAPDFEANTTQGRFRLADFRGSWLVLFSHPADFTPVCTTEFMAFARKYDAFQERGVQLLGLSVDSVPSHIAWTRNVEEKTGVKIPFPIIADLDRKVAQAYGMFQEGESSTETVRCVFVIDAESVLRAMIYYPLNVGRNVDEVLRLVDALQTASKHGVATPANWRPGEKVVVPAPTTQEGAVERLQEGLESVDWYLSFKEL
ncbi:peroxiredoxin [Limnochorda pilosa]|uniref:Peroxiredoxin n=1 Tax=Limnochorda pilosa TaxID=1555112 RepID=A0A0K2SR66_LIMPI|nr:peroxiredoxin [Limnochorda pilosa]BAS29314.1 peroxiredoxin [Limnochorda pilosa]